jgi:hypothetical protein
LHHSSLGWKPSYASKVLYLSFLKAIEAACMCGFALQAAMLSQQAQCVRLVVDALLEGRFSKVSVVLHMYEALQALIHDPQVTRPSLLPAQPPCMSTCLGFALPRQLAGDGWAA